jgi:hypothetical protein
VVIAKQVVDPEVSQTKFSHELSGFRLLEHEWRKKGILLLKSDFPEIQLAFIAPQLKPLAVAFAVSIDFTNYDVEPPSVKFIDPLTGLLVTTKEIYVRFFQAGEMIESMHPIPGMPQIQLQQPPRPILMGGLDENPFLCIPGVREYHNHPAHTGDPWLLHRTQGEGTLAFIIDQLYNHSIPFIRGYNINMVVGINQQIQ